jgi:hypothetical protein
MVGKELQGLLNGELNLSLTPEAVVINSMPVN